MPRKSLPPGSVAEAYLALLAERGVEYLFANAGTDFAPIVEALAKAAATGLPAPRPITATHENLAVSMAHGWSMVSGGVPAVMVHVSVGTANAACALMNAARENVPILLTAGRTPILEEDHTGSRDAYIHWGQEMFDQASLVREFVKWDYELRSGVQVETVVDRAVSIATSEPKGPVYLSLPREVLAAPLAGLAYDQPSRRVAAGRARPDEGAVAAAAGILAGAADPLIIAGNIGRDKAAVASLARFAERLAIPVVQYRSRYLALPCDHSMHLGYEPSSLISAADAVLVLDCDVPWIPKLMKLREDCRVIHAGHDPLHQRIPIRGFRCDATLASDGEAAVAALDRAIGAPRGVEERRVRIAGLRQKREAKLQDALDAARRSQPIHPAWVSHCLARVKPRDAILVNEYTLQLDHCGFTEPGTFFGSSSASGLGWGMGAALGAKLAAPDRLVIATLGDGSYIFANPVAAHHASRLHDLPILTLVMNNAMWNAVRRATSTVYPDGHAARSNAPAFTRLDALPAFEQVCQAAGGYGERVEDPAALPAALDRAIAAVTRDRRQALLNIITQPA